MMVGAFLPVASDLFAVYGTCCELVGLGAVRMVSICFRFVVSLADNIKELALVELIEPAFMDPFWFTGQFSV